MELQDTFRAVKLFYCKDFRVYLVKICIVVMYGKCVINRSLR